MNIGFLGCGAWGFCLATMLAEKGHRVISWSKESELINSLKENRQHPKFLGTSISKNLNFTSDLKEALSDADTIIESVTSEGVRPVFEMVKSIKIPTCPIIITSKGIEQNTVLTLPEVVLEVLGESSRNQIGVISGPGFAQEVIKKLPTSVVCSGFSEKTILFVRDLFTTQFFRVYPNSDITGVCYGGALKNIIAVACGIAGGLSLGSSCKAALMTRGLHEIRKLAVAKNCKTDTIYGLSGMGDLCLTCGSSMSRNYKFGELLAQGASQDKAKKEIDMVVEGVYACISALQLSKETGISLPITEMVYKILYENFQAADAVALLMQRSIKEEHL